MNRKELFEQRNPKKITSFVKPHGRILLRQNACVYSTDSRFPTTADQHRIFRYVKDRDKNSPWRTFVKFTDDVDPQWKQVLNDCGVQTIYALSPQAKGKVERPYEWLQDHIVRTCVREGTTKIIDGRKILQEEVRQYNEKRIHPASPSL